MMGLLTLLSDPSYLSSLRTAKLEIEEEEDPTDAPGSVTTSQDNFLTGMLAAISTTTNTPPPKWPVLLIRLIKATPTNPRLALGF